MKERLLGDLKKAMKERDVTLKNTVTLIRAAILQVEKDNKTVLDDEAILGVIAKQLKGVRDSLDEFEKANREDLATQARREIEILTAYLPAQMSEEEVVQAVVEAMQRLNVTSVAGMGALMGDLNARLRGRADGKLIGGIANRLIKEAGESK
jgi:uncharacterized protein YqeY